LRLGVQNAPDDAEQVEGAAREAINPRHRHHVTRGKPLEHAQKLAPVGPCARGLLAVDVPAAPSGGANLLKLAIEGLPVSADAGIADKPFFSGSVAVISYETFPKVLSISSSCSPCCPLPC
jgi:hypothetical protein